MMNHKNRSCFPAIHKTLINVVTKSFPGMVWKVTPLLMRLTIKGFLICVILIGGHNYTIAAESKDADTLLNMGRYAVFLTKKPFLPEKTKEQLYIIDYYKNDVYKNYFFGGSSGFIVVENAYILDKEKKRDKVGMPSCYTEVLLSFPLFGGKGIFTTDTAIIATNISSSTKTTEGTDSEGNSTKKAYSYATLLTGMFTAELYYENLFNIETTLIVNSKQKDDLTPYNEENIEQEEDVDEYRSSTRATYDIIDIIPLGITGDILHGNIP